MLLIIVLRKGSKSIPWNFVPWCWMRGPFGTRVLHCPLTDCLFVCLGMPAWAVRLRFWVESQGLVWEERIRCWWKLCEEWNIVTIDLWEYLSKGCRGDRYEMEVLEVNLNKMGLMSYFTSKWKISFSSGVSFGRWWIDDSPNITSLQSCLIVRILVNVVIVKKEVIRIFICNSSKFLHLSFLFLSYSHCLQNQIFIETNIIVLVLSLSSSSIININRTIHYP